MHRQNACCLPKNDEVDIPFWCIVLSIPIFHYCSAYLIFPLLNSRVLPLSIVVDEKMCEHPFFFFFFLFSQQFYVNILNNVYQSFFYKFI